jgi:nucleoside-diphosphate-sugar epimerase
VSIVNPPFIYGPFVPGFEIPSPNFSTISTDIMIFRLLHPDGPFPISRYIDVRDIALAHVLALSAGPSKDGRAKRIPIASPHPFKWTEAIAYVAAKRPELKDRLADPKKTDMAEKVGQPDFQRVQQVIGLKENEFRKWEETLLDTIDALVELEKSWKAKGYKIEIPLV